MKRREFCRTTVAASVAASFPFIAACEKKAGTPPPPKVDAGIPAISLNGAEIELEKAAVQELSDAFNGTVMLSGHPEYDGARRVWNGMHDRRPALIVRSAPIVNDVQRGRNVRARNATCSSRCVAAATAGPASRSCDGGMMLDLSTNERRSPSIRRAVPPLRRPAAVRLLNNLDTADSGEYGSRNDDRRRFAHRRRRLHARWRLRPAEPQARADDRQCSDQPCTSSRPTANRGLPASNDEPDLFWAVRGGGGNFGVVTSSFDLSAASVRPKRAVGHDRRGRSSRRAKC